MTCSFKNVGEQLFRARHARLNNQAYEHDNRGHCLDFKSFFQAAAFVVWITCHFK